MSRIYYNKLVRDNIEEKIKSKGSHCDVRALSDDTEFVQELLKKVREEAVEVAMARSREEFLAEYVDLMVVLDALTQQFEISEADIKVAMTENVSKKGLYKKRHFLHWSSDDGYQSNETPQGIQ